MRWLSLLVPGQALSGRDGRAELCGGSYCWFQVRRCLPVTDGRSHAVALTAGSGQALLGRDGRVEPCGGSYCWFLVSPCLAVTDGRSHAVALTAGSRSGPAWP